MKLPEVAGMRLTALVICLTIPSVASAQTAPLCPAPGAPLVYVGDRDFPPYEYIDDQNQPGGFNIQVVRALARELGVAIEIRLVPWVEARQARESGRADLFSAGYIPARSDQFDFLAATTTIRSSILMRPGRA